MVSSLGRLTRPREYISDGGHSPVIEMVSRVYSRLWEPNLIWTMNRLAVTIPSTVATTAFGEPNRIVLRNRDPNDMEVIRYSIGHWLHRDT